MPRLADKYRPASWDDVVGQDEVVSRLHTLAKRGGLAGRADWLSGQSGTGKTTNARLIAAEVADPFLIEELDAAALTVAQLQALEAEMQMSGWGEKSGRAYLINQAHALRKPVIRQLLVLLERIPRHVVIVFTTTCEGQDALFETSTTLPRSCPAACASTCPAAACSPASTLSRQAAVIFPRCPAPPGTRRAPGSSPAAHRPRPPRRRRLPARGA